MHQAGREIQETGWFYEVEIISPAAQRFCKETKAGPRNAKTGIKVKGLINPVKATIIDGDLPGYGIYVFCKTKADAAYVSAMYLT